MTTASQRRRAKRPGRSISKHPSRVLLTRRATCAMRQVTSRSPTARLPSRPCPRKNRLPHVWKACRTTTSSRKDHPLTMVNPANRTRRPCNHRQRRWKSQRLHRLSRSPNLRSNRRRRIFRFPTNRHRGCLSSRSMCRPASRLPNIASPNRRGIFRNSMKPNRRRRRRRKRCPNRTWNHPAANRQLTSCPIRRRASIRLPNPNRRQR